MALDPSIILQLGRGITPLKSPGEIQDEQMQRELGSYKLNALRQSTEDDQATRNALRSTGSLADVPNALLKVGNLKGAQEAQKVNSEAMKAQREAQKAELEGHLKKFELSGQIMNNVNDQPSWERARQETARIFGPEAAARLPEQYDPQLIAQNQARAMTVKDQMEQQYKKLTFGETQRHNMATEGNQAQGQAITMRGQDMTDTRARDLNTVKMDEVKLKREQKQETTDLTKQGQIASFDTMLGTIDRLSAHPGLEKSVGLRGKLPTIPGSDSANFQAELDTFQSQAFIPMVAQLKGMGALSDAEGKRLTQAVGALNPNMGEKAFRESVSRIKNDMEAARTRVAGQSKAPAASAAPDVTGIEAELKRRGLLK